MAHSTKTTRPSALLPVLLIPVMLFLVLPLYMITIAFQDLVHLDRSLLLKLLLLRGLYLLVFLAISLILARLLRLWKPYTVLLYFVLFWVTVSGLLFPIIRKATLVDPVLTQINPVSLGVTFCLSAGLTYLVFTKLRRPALILCLIMATLALLLKSPLVKDFSLEKPNEGIAVLSKTQNILILSFDGLPGRITRDLINKDSELRDRFSVFLVFTNVVSSMSTTIPSLMTELYGPGNLKDIVETEPVLHQKLRKEELLLNDPGYNSYAYGSYQFFDADEKNRIPKGGIAGKTSETHRAASIYEFFDFIQVRIGGPLLFHAANFSNRVLFPEKNPSFWLLGIRTDNTDGDLTTRVAKHTGTAWDKEMVLTVQDLDHFIDKLTVAEDRPCLRYMHFTFTHFPVDFDETLNYRSDDPIWHQNNQTETGARNETLGLLRRVADLIEKLKEIGVYDQSFIVIKSDHGKPVAYNDTAPDNLRINEHRLWGFSRYQPMLMIKPVNRSDDTPTFIHRLVTLDDLAITLRSRFSSSPDFLDIPGMDLLEPDEIQNGSFYLYVPKDPETHIRYDTHLSIKINRNESLYDQLSRNPAVRLSPVPE